MQAPKVDDDADIVAITEFLRDRLFYLDYVYSGEITQESLRDIRRLVNKLSEEFQIVFDHVGI